MEKRVEQGGHGRVRQKLLCSERERERERERDE